MRPPPRGKRRNGTGRRPRAGCLRVLGDGRRGRCGRGVRSRGRREIGGGGGRTAPGELLQDVNGRAVRGVPGFLDAVQRLSAGQTLKLQIMRHQQPLSLECDAAAFLGTQP